MVNKNFVWKIVLPSTLVVFLIILIGYFVMQMVSLKDETYQAVFLTNGQVYFGKVEGRAGHYLELKDIYYLQTKSQLQDQKQAETLGQADLSLIKLGNELHGPEDRMTINREHVLFIEDLSADSKVLKAIVEYKK